MSTSGSFSQSFTSTKHPPPPARSYMNKLVPRKRKASAPEDTRWNTTGELYAPFNAKERGTDDHLCSRCRRINFQKIFDITPYESVTDHGHYVCDLGQLTSFSKDGPCRLCSLFALIVDRNQRYEAHEIASKSNWHLRAFTTATLWNRTYAMVSRAQQLSIVIAVCNAAEERGNSIDRIGRGVILPYQTSFEPEVKDHHPCHIVPCSSKTNYGWLKEMLSTCDVSHVKCNERREREIPFPKRARVIDCQTRQIVPLLSEYTYVALSYVWGSKRPTDVSFDHGIDSKLADRLPSTIDDAIYATQALQFRYLWVDRYCVDQSQSADTRHQIGQMGNIYSHASITICALGSHDDAGLPGVSRPRKKQFLVEAQGMTLSWTGPSIRRHSQLSKWRSRGWTYQESVLSRRCLFFTEYFTALVCDGEISTENILSSHLHEWSFNKESAIYGDTSSWGKRKVLSPSQEFDKHLQEFQRRQLSHVTDTLNAFKGILSLLPVQSYWGIPIFPVVANNRADGFVPGAGEKEAGFIAGLCWKVIDSSRTDASDRHLFPSWSWVGQEHATTFENCLARAYQFQVDQRHFSVFQASIWAKDDTDQLTSIQDLSNQHSSTKIIPEQTQYIEMRSVMIRWQRKTKVDTNDVWQAGENGWWQSDYLGMLHPDTLCDGSVNCHANGGHSNCNHFRLMSGKAVLLALDVKHVGVSFAVRAVWLVVKQTKDGTYRRAGIIISRSLAKARSPIDRPSENLLETITLG